MQPHVQLHLRGIITKKFKEENTLSFQLYSLGSYLETALIYLVCMSLQRTEDNYRSQFSHYVVLAIKLGCHAYQKVPLPDELPH